MLRDLEQIHHMIKADNHTNRDPRSNLEKIAADQGFKISDNEGSGDCVFLSLSEQMQIVEGVTISHQELRQATVKYLEKNAKLVSYTSFQFSSVAVTKEIFKIKFRPIHCLYSFQLRI